MSSPRPDHDDALLAALVDDTISEADARRLLRRLEGDEDFRRRAVDAWKVDRLLAGLADEDDAWIDRLCRSVRSACQADGRSTDRLAAQVGRQIRSRQMRRPKRRWLPAVMSLAAALLVLVGGAWMLQRLYQPPQRVAQAPPADRPAVAEVVASTGHVRVGTVEQLSAPQPGTPVRQGDLLIARQGARLTIEYTDGTRIEASDGAVVEVRGRPKDINVYVRHGVVEAEVRERFADSPATIVTPHSTATVLGTQLSVAVGEQATRVAVARGRVRVSDAKNRSAVELGEGDSAVVAAGQAPVLHSARGLAPVADSYTGAPAPDIENVLRVDATPESARTAYLKFRVSGTAGMRVAGATLHLTVGPDEGKGLLRCRRGLDSRWRADRLTEADAPPAGEVLDTVRGVFAEGQVVAFEVTPAIPGDGEVTLIVETDARDLADMCFYSSEAGAGHRPRLTLTLTPRTADDSPTTQTE